MSHFGNVGHHLLVAIIDHIPNGWVGDVQWGHLMTHDLPETAQSKRISQSTGEFWRTLSYSMFFDQWLFNAIYRSTFFFTIAWVI